MFKQQRGPKLTYGGQSVRMNKTDELSDFSSQSILCAMDRFVKSVNHMNETVMVPCRLLDVSMESTTKGPDKVPGMLRGNNKNPYILYNVLNSIKNDLIWGPTSNDDDDNENHTAVPSPFVNNTRWSDSGPASTTTDNVKGHFRRQSTLSTISMASSTSDGESEGCFDGSEGSDSVLEAEEGGEAAINVMDSLRNHLVGLNLCLSSLTDTASYITDRYQDEVNT
ncbi:Mid1-interacting protein 1 [Chionoecetes opilio]|uniref:Mid1-interacting protein 1 n=1 Tax=Chionoecetes opilio TaxID=41210 RepID=A0A8J4YKI3_CHIOP|nr:Mid1-interacting protein 1 [Chionoecetes opilio]